MQYDRSKYLDYINNSEEWKLKRAQVISQRGYKCERCGSTRKIHIHHGTYKRLFNEELSDLFILCNGCHLRYHKTNKVITIQTTINFINRKSFNKTKNNVFVGKVCVPKREKTPQEKKERIDRINFKIELKKQQKQKQKEERHERHLARMEKNRLKKEKRKKISPNARKKAIIIENLERLKKFGVKLNSYHKLQMKQYGIDA
jgi:hypothetical protein